MASRDVEARIVEAYARLTVGEVPPSTRMVAQDIGPPVTSKIVHGVIKKRGLKIGPQGRRRAIDDDTAQQLVAEFVATDVSFRELARRMSCSTATIIAALMRANSGVMPVRTAEIIELEIEVMRPSDKMRSCLKCDRQVRGRYICGSCRAENARIA